MIEAAVVCDSISPEMHRLTTFRLRYPKFIHGEFMTHRMISRNASSSRAIPTKKLLEEVRSDELRAQPVFWGKNQSGMQAAEELSSERIIAAKHIWHKAALAAADQASLLSLIGAHKQIVNRILEPFSHINVVATATEWHNFFGLRLHKDAQPEMRALAEQMWAARNASTPKPLQPGDWHLPFFDWEADAKDWYGAHDAPSEQEVFGRAIKVSVARCARVSYESFETGKKSTVEEDLKLYERLGLPEPGVHVNNNPNPLHASPAEHQATPDEYMGGYPDSDRGDRDLWHAMNEWGNFTGWRQYRKMLAGEAVAPLPEDYMSF